MIGYTDEANEFRIHPGGSTTPIIAPPVLILNSLRNIVFYVNDKSVLAGEKMAYAFLPPVFILPSVRNQVTFYSLVSRDEIQSVIA